MRIAATSARTQAFQAHRLVRGHPDQVEARGPGPQHLDLRRVPDRVDHVVAVGHELVCQREGEPAVRERLAGLLREEGLL